MSEFDPHEHADRSAASKLSQGAEYQEWEQAGKDSVYGYDLGLPGHLAILSSGSGGLESGRNTEFRIRTILEAQRVYGNAATQRIIRQNSDRAHRAASEPARPARAESNSVPKTVQRSPVEDDVAWWEPDVEKTENSRGKAAAVADLPLSTPGISHNPISQPAMELYSGDKSVPTPYTPSMLRMAQGGIRGAEKIVTDAVGENTSGALGSFGTGVYSAGKDMVKGVYGAVRHPIDTIEGIERMGENFGPPGFANPLRLAHGIYDVASGEKDVGEAADHWLNPIESVKQSRNLRDDTLLGPEGEDGKRHGGMVEPYREAWDKGDYAEMLGRAGGDIASFVFGGGEVNEAGKTGEMSTAVRAAGETGEATAVESRIAEGNAQIPARGEMGHVTPYNKQPKAQRGPAGELESENEHVMAGAKLKTMTRNPHTGLSDYTNKHYRKDATIRTSREMALNKTHGNRGGLGADNPQTAALKKKVAAGEGIDYREDVFGPSLDNTKRARDATNTHAVTDEAINRGLLEQDANLFDIHTLEESGKVVESMGLGPLEEMGEEMWDMMKDFEDWF